MKIFSQAQPAQPALWLRHCEILDDGKDTLKNTSKEMTALLEIVLDKKLLQPAFSELQSLHLYNYINSINVSTIL